MNVQYSIPPYPVYSSQMNGLIGSLLYSTEKSLLTTPASMLQEYGTMRPSVFDILTRVHALRGTRSPYQYVSAASSFIDD